MSGKSDDDEETTSIKASRREKLFACFDQVRAYFSQNGRLGLI